MTHDDPTMRPTAHDVASSLRDIIRSMIISGRGKHGRESVRLARLRPGARSAAFASSIVGGQWSRSPWRRVRLPVPRRLEIATPVPEARAGL